MNEIYYGMYRCSLGSFVDFAFRELHPGERLEDNWHIRAIADLLQYTWVNPEPGTPRKLICNLPPGYLKTHICSVSLLAWVLGRDPCRSVLIIAETHEAALDIREQLVELMESQRYKWLFRRARIAKIGKEIELTYGGRIRHVGIGHTLPRRKSDVVVIDNPQSLHNLHRLDPGAFADIGSTLRDPTTGMIVLATRRLGENDLSSYFRSQHRWACMEVPVLGMTTTDWPGIFHDGYTYPQGELLHEHRECWDDVERRIRDMGGEAFSWQYMQGIYRPQTTGERLSRVDERGLQWKMIGSFDPTRVTLDDLGRIRADYLESLTMT